MSNQLGLHDPTKTRVFKLSAAESAKTELRNFLAGHISLIILGEFNRSSLHLTSANKLCLDGPDSQAVLWIKDAALLEAVKPYLTNQLSAFTNLDYDKILALSFRKNGEEVVYTIEKNPSSILKKMSKVEMFKAFAEAAKVIQS
ncbi:MAG: hypothetical protein R8P61_33230 [Bacteroidia bacterium]|nr:hypothetical protein [Bacteroidia bacterium]